MVRTAAVATPAAGSAARPLRRMPVQTRSVAKVARMLDTCAELIDEVGYEGLTTTLLAERAGVAIGSVYQFFPDKRAVVAELTRRNVEAYVRRLSERMATAFESGAMQRSIETAISLVGRLVDVAGNVGDIFASVFKAAETSGGGFIGTLQTITGQIAQTFQSPAVQSALQSLFQTMSTLATTAAPLLGSALGAIAQRTLSCDFALSKKPPDAEKIFAFFDNERRIARDPKHVDGWDYDATKNRVTFFGTACDDLRLGRVADVDIVFGCPEATPR